MAGGEQAAFRGCGFIHPFQSRDFRLWMFLGLPALLLLQGGCHLGAARVWGCLGLMANTEDHFIGCRCSCPSWSPCPGIWVRLCQEHGDTPNGGDFWDRSAWCLCPNTQHPCSIPLCQHDLMRCHPLHPACLSLLQGLILATCAGRGVGFWSQKLGRFRGPFCPWLQLGMVSGGLCQGGGGAQGSCLVLSLMPRKWCFSPRQRVFCPRGWIHLWVDTWQRVTRAAGGEEQRVPTPHLWEGGACGVQVTPWV